MTNLGNNADDLRQENADLRNRLEVSEETLRAIRSGEVDAITVETPAGVRVFTLGGADQPYRMMVETMSEGAVTVTPDGVILFCNQRFVDMAKAGLDTIIGSYLMGHFAADDQAKIAAALSESQSGIPCVRATLLASDGTQVPVNVAMHSETLSETQGVATVVTDLTAWQSMEVARERATRALRMINACNEIIIRATNEYQMLADMCQSMVDVGGYKLVWVGYAEHDEAKSVRPVAQAGSSGNYVENAKITWADTERGRGPTGTAIRTGRSIVARDTETEPHYEPWRRMAEERGFRSSATFPLRADHDVFGALMIYSARPDGFDEEETRLLAELAGNLEFGITVLRAITERKRIQTELQESVTLFHTLADSIPQMVWMCTPDGLNIYFSQQWIDYTGLTLDESYGRGWNVPFHPDDKQSAWDAWNRATKTGEIYSIESRLRAADGHYRWFLMKGAPLRDTTGQIVKWFGTCTDIDELKHRQETLHKANAYNRSLIETSLDPLVTIALDGKISDANHATEEAIGLSRETLIGTEFSGYFTDREKANEGYRQVFHEGSIQNYELELRRGDGTTMPVLYNASVYRDEAGEVAGIFAAARDISERKNAEAQLLQHRQHLEELVATRTSDLERAIGGLTAANQELETFAYSVSHDLRAPLRAIDGFSNILLKEYSDKLDAEGKRLLQVVRDGATRMGHLIEDILSFSRINRQELYASDTAMAPLIQDALRELAPAMADRAIEMKVGPLPRVVGDPKMLQRVWTNLLDNAIKYTGAKPNTVIEVGARAEGGETVFFVKDNGVGFDMQYADKLFGVFQRLHRAEQFPGTGIGLAIIKRIVTRHCGRVWAEGKVGEGATFYFALPQTGVDHA